MTPRTLGLTDPLHQYLMQVGFREHQALKLVREKRLAPGGHMMLAPEQAQFMALLTRLLGVRRYLEIGTYTGYSALAVALAMEADGRVVTCEIDEAIAATAQRHWRHAGVTDKIEFRLGPALETLDAMLAQGERGRLDMAFIDADKENLLAYYERCHALVRIGGSPALGTGTLSSASPGPWWFLTSASMDSKASPSVGCGGGNARASPSRRAQSRSTWARRSSRLGATERKRPCRDRKSSRGVPSGRALSR